MNRVPQSTRTTLEHYAAEAALARVIPPADTPEYVEWVRRQWMAKDKRAAAEKAWRDAQ